MNNIELKERPFVLENVKYPTDLDLTYEILDPSDESLLIETAQCLAETFAGIEINGKLVREPMVAASNLSVEDMFKFNLEYMKNVVDQELIFIARERETGEVVGVIACEDFDPYEEAPVFEGSLEPMNNIIDLLLDLDERFIDTIEYKTNKKPTTGEYVHLFMGGIKYPKHQKYIFVKLVETIVNTGIERGYKGFFGEATNIKSIKLMLDYCNFYTVKDRNNNTILTEYSSNEVFKSIPENIATDCRIVYKHIDPSYEL